MSRDIGSAILWVIGVLGLGVVFVWLRGHFNAETRERRRRERSHRRVISRKQGPTVKLAVNAGKPKDERKR